MKTLALVHVPINSMIRYEVERLINPEANPRRHYWIKTCDDNYVQVTYLDYDFGTADLKIHLNDGSSTYFSLEEFVYSKVEVEI